MFMLLVAIVTVLIFGWLRWNYSYWKRMGVPGPEPSYIIGNLGPVLSMKKHFASLYQEWYVKYGSAPYIGFYKIFNPAIMLRDPELIKNVLIKDFNHFEANDFAFDEKLDPLLAYNPFHVAGDQWRESRNLVTPLFTAAKSKHFFSMMLPTCEKLCAYIKAKGTTHNHDSKSLCAKYTTENVARCVFSVNAGCFDGPKCEFREMGKSVIKPSLLVSIKMTFTLFCPLLLKLIPIPFMPPEVDRWMRNLVASNIRSREGIKMQSEDLLQMLINLRQQNRHVTDEQLAGFSLTVFIEGFETSSTLLSFVLYQLAMNPDIQERLREEIQDVIAKNNDEFNFAALTEMTYLEAIFQETLRLHVPAMSLPKVCTKDYTLPASNGGVTIKKGTIVVIPVYAIHMDPVYYPEPERFDPSRFTDGHELPKCTFLPFGEGPRMCMGVKFAMTQTKVAAVAIVQHFLITLSKDHKPFVLDPTSFLYNAKDGIILNFKPLK